jgi:hypothetical protein
MESLSHPVYSLVSELHEGEIAWRNGVRLGYLHNDLRWSVFTAWPTNLACTSRCALLAWLAIKSKATTLANLVRYFGRDLSTVSHALSRLEDRSRKSDDFANSLNQYIYAISRA